jgi:hypothetical protein
MALFTSNRPSTILGLTLEGRQLEGLVLSRSNGSYKVAQTFRASLSLDPLTDDPELVGREIRNRLEEARISERRCVVGIPLPWVLTLHSKLPAVPEADLASFLQLEAERGFPYAPGDLSIATSRYATSQGEQHALQVAVPKSHLTLLEKVLRAARLKPLSFTLGITALQEAKMEADTGFLTLAVGETGVELQVSAGGGVAALRALEGAIDTEGADKHVDTDLLAREIRITLGQLPKELREAVSRIEVFGNTVLTVPLVKELIPMAHDLGLLVGDGTVPHAEGLKSQGSSSRIPLAAFCLAAGYLDGVPARFEILPPKESAWNNAVTRFSSAKVLYSSAAVGAILLFVCGAFVWQEWKLLSLESKYRSLKPRITEVEAMQQQTRKYRAWYDESVKSLRIVKRVTEVFPEEGSVTLKMLEIKDLTEVTCQGQARDTQAWLALLDRLGKVPQITNLKGQQASGTSPLQFTFNFRWSEGVSREN